MPIHQAEKLLMESCVKNPIVFTSVRGGGLDFSIFRWNSELFPQTLPKTQRTQGIDS